MTTYQVIEYITLNLITSASRVVGIDHLSVASFNRATISFIGKLIFLYRTNDAICYTYRATCFELFIGAPWCDIKTKIRHVTLQVFANGLSRELTENKTL